MLWRPSCSTLFPYTTLFRSRLMDNGKYKARQQAECVDLTTGNIEWPKRILPYIPLTWNLVRGEDYGRDRKSTRLNSSHVKISYAVFCLKKKNKQIIKNIDDQ